MIQTFYLGAHMPHWLADPRRRRIPLFVARQRLARYRRLPRAIYRWALDSGGFMHLKKFGRWTVTPRVYAMEARRYKDEIGMMDFAAPQDWMCEDKIRAVTRLSIREHQRRTVRSFVELRDLDPGVPWIPVLQGMTLDDYHYCVDLYDRAGVDLSQYTVGVGSVCRRQATEEIRTILASLASYGFALHGFGVKLLGLKASWSFLRSADSMAWSYNARKNPVIQGHTHKTCANCFDWAERWYHRVDGQLGHAWDRSIERWLEAA